MILLNEFKNRKFNYLFNFFQLFQLYKLELKYSANDFVLINYSSFLLSSAILYKQLASLMSIGIPSPFSSINAILNIEFEFPKSAENLKYEAASSLFTGIPSPLYKLNA